MKTKTKYEQAVKNYMERGLFLSYDDVVLFTESLYPDMIEHCEDTWEKFKHINQ